MNRAFAALAVLAVVGVICGVVWLSQGAPTVVASPQLTLPTDTPTPTSTPTALAPITFVNTSGGPADWAHISGQFSHLTLDLNAPGCSVPALYEEIIPVSDGMGGFTVLVKVDIRWPTLCVDPGESISVRLSSFGEEPVGSFYNSALSFPPVPPIATPTVYLAVDCDLGTAGIQDNCSYDLASTTSVDVGVVIVNNSLPGPVGRLGSLTINVEDSDVSRLNPPPGADVNLNGNPDLNESDVTGTWVCAGPGAPDNDTGTAGAGKALSTLGCFVNTPAPGDGPFFPVGAQLVMAIVHYQIPPSASPGSVVLLPAVGSVADGQGVAIGDCHPGEPAVMLCLGANVHLFAQPTATPTATPDQPGMTKVPEGNQSNTDQSIPAANLWLCNAGPCSGPGEGDLIVSEYAINVHTGDQDNDSVEDGLGAYEFQVEYDNLVIQSVNASDVVFSPGGAGANRGPATCSFSIILENVVRFGCVTTGPTPPGPTGDFHLARLDLVPHPDLVNDVFPGNDNGVLTVIKDNGCELADVFGHPVTGSINGGLLPICRDLAVTVRILEGDMNLDCKVDVADEQLIAMHYSAVFGSAYYSKWFDLEPATHDLDVDIKDLQKVFGRDGSTCQNPVPEQTPLPPPVPFLN